MRKLISWIVIGSLLVIVPLGSWYYLQQGLSYRKDALEALKPKSGLESLPDSVLLFQGKTSLVVFENNKNINDIVAPIYEQYKDSYTFQIVGKMDIPYVLNVDDEILQLFENKGQSFAIVDTSGTVRNYYTSEVKQLRDLVEHLAIVLPRAKEKDIKMKSDVPE